MNRVHYLSEVHLNREHQQQSVLFIKTHYQPGDLILVEDDASKTEGLNLSQIPGIHPSRYRIKGWCDPEAFKKDLEFCKLQHSIQEALESFQLRNPHDQFSNALKLLFYYTSSLHNFTWDFVEIDLGAQLKIAKLAKKKMVDSRVTHVWKYFAQHQASQEKIVNDYLAKGTGKIFVIQGELHTRQPTLLEQVVKFFHVFFSNKG